MSRQQIQMYIFPATAGVEIYIISSTSFPLLTQLGTRTPDFGTNYVRFFQRGNAAAPLTPSPKTWWQWQTGWGDGIQMMSLAVH